MTAERGGNTGVRLHGENNLILESKREPAWVRVVHVDSSSRFQQSCTYAAPSPRPSGPEDREGRRREKHCWYSRASEVPLLEQHCVHTMRHSRQIQSNYCCPSLRERDRHPKCLLVTKLRLLLRFIPLYTSVHTGTAVVPPPYLAYI